MTDPGATVVWDDRFRAYDFGLNHPFSETPRYLAVSLLRAWERSGSPSMGSTRWVSSVEPATKRELEAFHRSEYLDLVERSSEFSGHLLLDRGDTPSFPGCFDAAARIASGFSVALRSAEETGKPAFHPAGGLHHASPTAASGFCIFNDLAVGIATELKRRQAPRVAYIDIDAHHGDGVMYGFYDNGKVLDIDFHQDGRTLFPGTGRIEEAGVGDGAGLKVNVPLPPDTGDEAFIPLFRRLVPTLLREFHPDLIILQHGVDAHAGDRLAQLQYTRAGYVMALSTVLEVRRELGFPRFVTTGGGGYTPAYVACRLAEAGFLLTASDGTLPPDFGLPTDWQTEFHRLTEEDPPLTIGAESAPTPSGWSPDHTERMMARIARQLGRRFPREEPDEPGR